MTQQYLALAILAIFVMPISQVHADGHDLKQRADHLLKTEPDAQRVHIKEEVSPKVKGGKSIRLMDFDLNGDGILTQSEIGEKLFKIFDKDHNGVIDNREMKKVGFLTILPMQKKLTETIEYKTPDRPIKTTVSEEEFLQRSQLVKFDKDEDGLSPLDFLGMSFLKVNVKKDDVIDLYEWKRAYADSVKPEHEEAYNYNN